MKVVIPFVPNKLRPEVRAVGEQVSAEFVDVSHCEFAYFCLIAKLWAAGAGEGESFILLEHDVLPTVALLEEMWDCPHEWCHAYSWRYTSPLYPGETRPAHPTRQRETALFCHKISASLLRQMGTAMPRGPIRWQSLDFFLLGWLAQVARPHLHGPVTHLHQQHPAWAATMTEDDWGRVDA